MSHQLLSEEPDLKLWNYFRTFNYLSKKKKLILLVQIQDARAAMLLYQKNRKEWEKSAKDQMRLKLKQKKRKPKKKAKQGDVVIDHAPTAL